MATAAESWIWDTPHGLIAASVHERYTGLHDQPRIALVDRHGRVHHYDADEVTLLFPHVAEELRSVGG